MIMDLASISHNPSFSDADSPCARDSLQTARLSVAFSTAAVNRLLELIRSDDRDSKLQAAREIRRRTKTSHRSRRQLAEAVEPLVSMLRLDSPDPVFHESALLALLNLAVKDEKNKIKIIEAGALEPIMVFLGLERSDLQEYATASLLTLSASAHNKPIIGAAGAISLLVRVLRHGSPQAKVDAVMALSNLSTFSSNLGVISELNPVSSIINLLQNCIRSSKTAEKCSSLVESLMEFKECRAALLSEGGVLTLVEVLENGSLQGREHAVGCLLAMCQNERSKYRDPILGEGVIPGLLELTVHGTPKSRAKAQKLLRLLRDSQNPRPELEPDTLENIFSDIISRIDGDNESGKAKKMVAEMVQVSMEQSLRHLQRRASLVCTQSDLPVSNQTSEVSSKLLGVRKLS